MSAHRHAHNPNKTIFETSFSCYSDILNITIILTLAKAHLPTFQFFIEVAN